MSKNRRSGPSFIRVCTQRLIGHAINRQAASMKGVTRAAKNLSMPSA